LIYLDVSNFRVPFLDKPLSKKSDKVIKKKTVHEQEDGTILAVAATGTSNKNSLLSWVHNFFEIPKSNLIFIHYYINTFIYICLKL